MLLVSQLILMIHKFDQSVKQS